MFVISESNVMGDRCYQKYGTERNSTSMKTRKITVLLYIGCNGIHSNEALLSDLYRR